MADENEIVVQIPDNMEITEEEVQKIAEALRSRVVDVSEGARAAGAMAKEKHVPKEVQETAQEKTYPIEKIVRTEPAPRR
ncbi:hypothetical protein [uncultured Hoeflea sp.]|uniref:hypothetical protein n=1 Tax=uncultured Hoeflea sp. TaxID=538666 RepID=UPI0026088A3F|nr:hypothetical protein [uncultured Hoeflea sp.]